MCQFVDWHTAPMGRFFYDYRKAGAVAMYFRLQRYPPPRLISYRIPRQGSTATDRVPVREVSTICTQRAVLVYCYLKFKNDPWISTLSTLTFSLRSMMLLVKFLTSLRCRIRNLTLKHTSTGRPTTDVTVGEVAQTPLRFPPFCAILRTSIKERNFPDEQPEPILR